MCIRDRSLIADGCVLISQHADTTGASTACEKAGVPIVGYNVSMIATAPTQALTSASIDWGPYYTYAVKSVIDGTKIEMCIRDRCYPGRKSNPNRAEISQRRAYLSLVKEISGQICCRSVFLPYTCLLYTSRCV